MKDLDSVFKAYAFSEKSTSVKFLPVDRINTIIAVAPNPGIFPQVKEWIEKLDIPVKITAGAINNYVYRLKYGRAETVAMAIMALYTGNVSALMSLAAMSSGMGMGHGHGRRHGLRRHGRRRIRRRVRRHGRRRIRRRIRRRVRRRVRRRMGTAAIGAMGGAYGPALITLHGLNGERISMQATNYQASMGTSANPTAGAGSKQRPHRKLPGK